jgi:hypothetical protein
MNIKQHLQQKTKSELVNVILDLNRKFPDVQSYFESTTGDEKVVTNKYRRLVRSEFFPPHGDGNARASVVRKYLREFKKLPVSAEVTCPHQLDSLLAGFW